MYPYCKGPRICDSTLEKPYRLRFDLLASSPYGNIHNYCIADPMAVSGSYQFSHLLSYTQERVYN